MARSVEAIAQADRLRVRLAKLVRDAELGKYVMHDYVVLYALIRDSAFMLSIKHDRQLSFDLGRFWGPEPKRIDPS